ncbi:polyprotein [Codonopsis torradovirus A]|uniref:RNA1 polyprotein n=1 Tax=Codonopsis torradovirus A TaxID=2879515 RepID=A0A8K1HUD0_9SECO|nr:polyprotein [Codonopsis torradovirus A]UBS89877.1 polyprotein [Codonopsis torradovirus A]
MFSKLKAAMSGVAQTGRNVGKLLDKSSDIADTLSALEGPFSGAVVNAEELIVKMHDLTLPKINQACDQAVESMSAIKRVFIMLEKLMTPLFGVNDFFKTTWGTLSSLFVRTYEKVLGDGMEGLLQYFTKDTIQDYSIPLGVIIFLCSILLLKLALPSGLIQSFLGQIVNILTLIKGFVLGLLPEGPLSKWFGLYHDASMETIVAQGPTGTLNSETNGFGFNDILTGTISMGFVSLMYFLVGSEKPGRKNPNPISGILCSTGDHAQKLNSLFTFFKNVKTSFGDTMLWVGEWICDVTGFASPLSATINMVLNTDLFKWFNEVNRVCDPAKRLENFASPSFNKEASLLRDQVTTFEAQFLKYPVSPFVATRFNNAVSKLDKLLESAHAHKGVGQFRREPYCVQFFGAPGCGKTMSMNFFIDDLLNRMKEPQNNRLYSLSSKDGYWSNYNHQTAVLIDDFGQILDAAQQSSEVKDFIFMKSCAPMSLNMAAIEEKGTQFTSKYIFLTSNFATPEKTVGVADLQAVQRRRNLLVKVRRSGPINERCKTPVDNLTFTVCNSLRPFREQEGQTDLSYAQLLDIAQMNCEAHWVKDEWMGKFSGGLERNHLEAQGPCGLEPLGREGPSEVVDDTFAEHQLASFKNAFVGDLATISPFEPNSVQYNHFEHAPQDIKMNFMGWRNEVLINGIADSEVQYWETQIAEGFRHNLMAWLDYFTFDEEAFSKGLHQGKGKFCSFVSSDDIDALMELRRAPPRSQFAFAVIVRQYRALQKLIASRKKKKSYVEEITTYIKEVWQGMPIWVKCLIKVFVAYQCCSLAFGYLFSFVAPDTQNFIQAATTSSIFMAEGGRSSGRGNISGDEATKRPGNQRKTDRFLTAQFSSLSDEWTQWAIRDPFLQESLIKNMVVIRLSNGSLFRGIYVRPGWILSVGHAFLQMADGTVISIVHERSTIPVAFNRASEFYKPVPNQDLALVYVGDVDGIKKDIVSHFATRAGVMCAVGAKGVLVKPVFTTDGGGKLIKNEIEGVSMTSSGIAPVSYSDSSFKCGTAGAYSFQYPGQNGDCGSVLMLPSVGNRQPVICGIHCAGSTPTYLKLGYMDSHASAIYREDIDTLLPVARLQAQGPCPLLRDLRESTSNPFELKQVAFMGYMPKELSINVPHKTTLRKSEIFDELELTMGPHKTEPSILVASDSRVRGVDFDPYVKGVEKFNETAHSFDMSVATLVMQHMKADLLAKLQGISVPGGKPVTRTEHEVLNGIPGEEFYDGMDMSTAVGYPFTLSEHGKNKRGYIEGEPGDYMLHRERPVYPEFCALDDDIRTGSVQEMITCECAKDERLPCEKIYEKPKTRLFTILPFHYNMLVRKYFLDFSASLMRARGRVACKVGINPEGVEWTQLAHAFLEKSSAGFSADYSSFDGRAPVFVFQWFCDMVDAYYGDHEDSESSKARHALLMMASCHYTLCGDKCFRVVGGMPSGFSLTVLFNSLLNEFYMRYAFEKLLRKPSNAPRVVNLTQRNFDNLFVAIYGDDNLVAVPFEMRWYSLPAIADELLKVNVVIKNGLDKTQDVSLSQFQPLGELTFLSRAFKRHVSSFYLAPLKWVSVTEPLRWIRPSSESPAIEALLENAEGSLRAAFMHGKAAFEGLRKQIQDAFCKRQIPIYDLPIYEELERIWLSGVTGNTLDQLVSGSECPILELPKVSALSPEEVLKKVNTFVDGVYFCSARTAKHVAAEDYIFVNCTASSHPKWIRGPACWRDLDNKIWAFTVAAIEVVQSERVRNSQKTDLLFVCPGGIGMSVICCALAALSCSQYTKGQVVTRLRELTAAKEIATLAGGAGHYVLLAAQSHESWKDKREFSMMYGNNAYDRCLRIGNCCIITGKPSVQFPPNVFWAAPDGGFGGVRTNINYIRKVDPRAATLGGAIQRARNQRDCFFLFFTTFRAAEAEWVLTGIRNSGASVGDILSTDLVLLERHARALGNCAFGRITVKVSTGWNKDKRVELVKTHELLNEKRIQSSEIPFDSSAFLDVPSLREAILAMPDGVYHTRSLVDACKMLTASCPTIPHIEKVLGQFFPDKEMCASLELYMTLHMWSGLGMCSLSEVVPEALLKEELNAFKYIVRDPTVENFPLHIEEYENSLESVNLSLHMNYTHSAIKNHKVFRLPATMPHVIYLVVGLFLENKIRKKNKEDLLELPPWFPVYCSVIDTLSYLSLNYV